MDRGEVRHFELTRPSLHDIFVRIAAPEAPEDAEVPMVRKILVIAPASTTPPSGPRRSSSAC